jgi:UDP-N-acetylmuramoyl-L-alanyl-D-glutamate--2,6-diaminopimelate ligase
MSFVHSSFKRLKSLIPERHPLRLGWHYGRAFFAALLHGFPARALTVIAITGTDGKTTTVAMVTHILRKSGKKVGSLSTAYLDIAGSMEENPTHKTSVSPFILQKFLQDADRAGCSHVVIEASSHGLVQGRLSFLWPQIAAVTNVTPEHLDYHGSFEKYRDDKGKLLKMLRSNGTKVLNGNDGSFISYKKIPSHETIVYANGKWKMENGKLRPTPDIWLSDVEEGTEGVRAILRTSLGGEVPLKISLLGTFNLENALAAIGCATAASIPLEQCVRALVSFKAVPGRLEEISEGQPFRVYVDFTVTPAAYEKTLAALRASLSPPGHLLALCSACGNRMREKRPLIGKIVSERADVCVITSDETYGEDPIAVLEEVWSGVPLGARNARKIIDRREAIRFLVKEARPGDVVVLCGMGPYRTMQTLQGEIPWDEREVTREELRKLGYQK